MSATRALSPSVQPLCKAHEHDQRTHKHTHRQTDRPTTLLGTWQTWCGLIRSSEQQRPATDGHATENTSMQHPCLICIYRHVTSAVQKTATRHVPISMGSLAPSTTSTRHNDQLSTNDCYIPTLTFTFTICYRPSVSPSVTFVRHTQPVKIFRNVSMPVDTLAIHWHPQINLQRSSQGNPSVGGLKQYIAILALSKTISQKRCKTGGNLVLITNRKLHVSFWLVPKSVTLNDLERHNGPYLALFHRTRQLSRRIA